MIDALVLVPAGVCVGCAARGVRPGRVSGTVSAALMLVAMLDTGIGPRLVPAAVWAAALFVAAVGLAVSGRTVAASTPGHGGHGAHGAVGLVLMAALILGMPPGSGTMAEMPDMGPNPFAAVMLVGTLAFAVASAVQITRERSTPRRIESGAMALSVALMALPLAL